MGSGSLPPPSWLPECEQHACSLLKLLSRCNHPGAHPPFGYTGREAQRVAFLLFCWSILGWLLPTLLLLPDAVGGASRLAGLPEAALRLLLPSKPQAMQPRAQQQGQLGGAASCALYWLAVLLVVWGTCCSVAPLFKAAHASAA